jgi:hypothetical protein
LSFQVLHGYFQYKHTEDCTSSVRVPHNTPHPPAGMSLSTVSSSARPPISPWAQACVDGFTRLRAVWTNDTACWSEDLANQVASCSNALTLNTPRAVKSSWSRAMMPQPSSPRLCHARAADEAKLYSRSRLIPLIIIPSSSSLSKHASRLCLPTTPCKHSLPALTSPLALPLRHTYLPCMKPAALRHEIRPGVCRRTG